MKLVAVIANFLTQFDPPALPVDASLPPVVLVHGIHCNAVYLTRLERFFRAQGREVITPSLTPNHGTAKLEDLAAQLRDVIDNKLPSGQRFDLVSHSMGGLVARYYVQRLGGAARTRQLITMATPNHGTWLAYLHPGAGARQMRPGSDFLRELNADRETWKQVPMVNFYTPLDLVIVPFTSSKMPGEKNQQCWALTHPSFIVSRTQFKAVGDVLASR